MTYVYRYIDLQETQQKFTNIMKVLKYTFYALVLAGFASCGASSDKNIKEATIEQSPITDEDVSDEGTENISLINTVYEKFVFATDSQSDENPEKYFSDNALKKLQDDYEFDCKDGSCYAFYALRTEMQDSNPGTDGASGICDIEPDGDGWYMVSYIDMGWTGKTRIKIIDGNKIDDYQRISQ